MINGDWLNNLIFIAHRANIYGKTDVENTPKQIDYCINNGFDVEIDLWSIDQNLFLGHDYPEHKIDFQFLEDRNKKLWIHCKNESTLFLLQNHDMNYFWHENDDFTLTSKKFIWTYPNKQNILANNQIILDFNSITKKQIEYYSGRIYGICSDDFSFL